MQDFGGKRGVELKVTEHPKLQYEVDVGNKVVYVYHDELLVGWPEKRKMSIIYRRNSSYLLQMWKGFRRKRENYQ